MAESENATRTKFRVIDQFSFPVILRSDDISGSNIAEVSSLFWALRERTLYRWI